MNHMRSFSRRTSCLVLVTALLCATFGTDTAIAQPPRSPFRKEAELWPKFGDGLKDQAAA